MFRSIAPLGTVLCLIAALGFASSLAAAEPEPAETPPQTQPLTTDDPAAPPSRDILDTLARTEKFNTFLKAVKAAGFEEKLRELGPFTVLAPNDEAFAKLPKETLEALLADKVRMTDFLRGHVAPKAVSSKELAEAKQIKTLSATTLTVTPPADDMPLKIENACVLNADVAATNGVVHVIDVVLVPK